MASEDFTSRLKSLISRFGFRPDEVSVSGRFGVGTISFKNQKGKATELVAKLRGAMKQMGVPEAAITAREVQYPADADGPAEHWGVVNVDFNKMPHSRPGAKAKFEKEYILWALPKGETDRLHERPIVEGIKTPSQMDEAKRKAASQGWHGFRVQILDMSKPFRWMSRPGAKAKMAVEDRFYFGKGRKERFGIEDRVDSLIAGAYRALKNGDKSAAKRMIREAEVLASSEPTLPANILNDLKDLKKSMRF